MDDQICVLCGRELGTSASVSRHHLIPKSKGGRYSDTILIHNICHQKIHSVFTEKELQQQYNTVEALKGHEAIRKFIKWVSKKDPDFYQSNRRMIRP